jgi:uncharacterized membrane protein YcaP (DUF421 family)
MFQTFLKQFNLTADPLRQASRQAGQAQLNDVSNFV